MGVPRFERFFRTVASLDVDKDDLRRYSDFVNQQLYDMLIVGRAAANANGRDVVEPRDLPITTGLEKSIHRFDDIDEEIELQPPLDAIAERRPVDLTLSVDTEARLPRIVGGVGVALAESFKIIDPEVTNPSSRHWDRAFRLFELLL
jgi:Domain of unknown function (DUF1931)